MPGKLSEIRQKIRAILDSEDSTVIEVARIMTRGGNLETALRAAKAEKRVRKDAVEKAILSNLIARIHLDSSRFSETLETAQKAAGRKGIPNPVRAYSYCIIATVYLRREEYMRTEAYCKKALALTEENDDAVLVYVLNITGVVHYLRGKYSLALEYHKSHKKVSEKLGSKTQLIRAVGNIAITLSHLGRDEEGIEYLLQAREIGTEIGDKLSLGYTANNLAYYRISTGKLEEALDEAREALRIFEETGHKWMFADCHMNFALAYLEQGKVDLAAEHARKALSCAEELEQRTNLPRAHNLLGRVLAAQGNPVAGTHFTKSIELYRRLQPDKDAEGIEFAMLEYGKYLLAHGESEGATHVRKAAEVLKRRPPTIEVRKAREELRELLAGISEESHPAPEEKVEKVERDRDNFRKILEITKAINSETETEEVLERILDAAIETSGAERGFIVLVEDKNWEFAAQSNFPGNVTSDSDYPTICEIAAKVISDGTVFTAGNIRRSETFGRLISAVPSALKGVFAFPLAIKEKVMGAVYLDSRFAVVDLPQETVSFMVTLMEQAALIIDKARLYQRVRALSEKLGEKLEKTRLNLEQTRSDLEKKQQELELRYSYKNIIGKSAKMQELFQLLDRVAETDIPVFICGESGTGKELVAKAIHYNGPRRKRHFMALNCAAIPESLLESELFGYEKGAFTGADTTKKGLFEITHGGTFFLDEIGNMSAGMQRKLLRVLQEKAIRRVGGKKLIDVDTRIVSASNVDPRQLIDAGELREDLYYRLNVLTIELPPLRERKEDIPHLVEHFWERATNTSLEVSEDEKKEFLKILMDYEWPGNVRELENEISRVASIGDGTLNAKYLSRHILTDTASEHVTGVGKRLSLREIEESLIKAALEEAEGNKSRAARILGIPRTTLTSKLKKLGISCRIEISS